MAENTPARKSRSRKNLEARKNIGVGAETVALLDRIWSKVRTFAKDYAETELPIVQMVTGTGQFGMPRGSIRLGSYITKRNGDGIWTHKATGQDAAEFFVSGEVLGRGAVEALTTILHEATHALCATRREMAQADMVEAGAQMLLTAGDADEHDKWLAKKNAAEAEMKAWKETTRQDRYHNKIFAEKAKTFGLEYTHPRANEDVGYSAVTLSEMGAILWADELNDLEKLTPAYIELVFVPVTADPSDDRVRVAPTGGADEAPIVSEPRQHRRAYRCGCNRSILAYPADLAEAPVICGRCGGDFE